MELKEGIRNYIDGLAFYGEWDAIDRIITTPPEEWEGGDFLNAAGHRCLVGVAEGWRFGTKLHGQQPVPFDFEYYRFETSNELSFYRNRAIEAFDDQTLIHLSVADHAEFIAAIKEYAGRYTRPDVAPANDDVRCQELTHV